MTRKKQVSSCASRLGFDKRNLIHYFILSLFILLSSASFAQCGTGDNFFTTLGGTSSSQKVTSTDGCKTLVMDDGFEIITLVLGNIPAESGDFTIVNYDAVPAEGEVAVKYYYYSGNEIETMEFNDTGKTAHVCVNGTSVTVTWSGVVFKGSTNGNLNYKTDCEMTCSGN